MDDNALYTWDKLKADVNVNKAITHQGKIKVTHFKIRLPRAEYEQNHA